MDWAVEAGSPVLNIPSQCTAQRVWWAMRVLDWSVLERAEPRQVENLLVVDQSVLDLLVPLAWEDRGLISKTTNETGLQ
jgi:hypothetical protein